MLNARASQRHVLLLVRTESAYGRRFIEGVIRFAETHRNWDFLFAPGSGSLEEQMQYYRQPDGVILDSRVIELAALCQQRGVPCVVLGGAAGEYQGPRICSDNLAVGKMAARFFLDRGFRQLAYCGVFSPEYSRLRQQAAAEVAREADVPLHVFEPPTIDSAELTWTQEQDHLTGWLRRLPKPVGVIAANDGRSLQVAEACRVAELLIPEQVAILGVDNDELLCRLTPTPLSSIDHGASQMGWQAAQMLERLMAGEEPSPRIEIVQPTGIVERRSTDALAIADTDVAAALRFIRQHATDGIGVTDVLRQVPAARRTLEINFRRLLGRTIHQEIQRQRLEHARHLLVETKLSLPEIAARSGFNYASRLSSVHKSHFGISPMEYRRSAKGR